MSASIIERKENSVTIQVTIALSQSMLDTEQAIQQALNQAGVLASAEALEQFDTDGSPLLFGSSRFTTKGQEPKTYQTPYGPVSVPRHVYQTGEGGTTFCPLERDARIILTSTPRFAMLISPMAREEWLQDRRHKLKHEKGYAVTLLAEMQGLSMEGLSETVEEELSKAKTYYQNHHTQMKYAERVEAGLPIGSGVTEAACKTILKMRMCRGGAKWKEEGAAAVLSLRTLIYSEGRWEQFWDKVDRYGFPVSVAA